MKKSRNIIIGVLVLSIILTAAAVLAFRQSGEDFRFQYWREEAGALTALREYVRDVTDERSANYIPKEDRIAVFDMDGTLYGEKAPIYLEWWMFAYRVLKDPSFAADADLAAVGEKIVKAAESGVIPEELEREEALAGAKAFAGMSLDEYEAYVSAFLEKEADGFSGMTYAEAWYLPMLEVVDYLNRNEFTVYICSGTDRFLCRTLAEGKVDIPARQIIGMDVLCVADGQGDADGLEYVYSPDDEVVRSDRLIIKNVKANKVSNIAQEIGAKPVLSFGNSSGDTSMAMYTTSKNPYRSMAFMVVADDTEREYGDSAKAEKLRNTWDSNGWVSISMKDDWLTVYKEQVSKSQYK